MARSGGPGPGPYTAKRTAGVALTREQIRWNWITARLARFPQPHRSLPPLINLKGVGSLMRGHVYGLIYELSPKDEESLDKYEGAYYRHTFLFSVFSPLPGFLIAALVATLHTS